jgi:hypothetical protein
MVISEIIISALEEGEDPITRIKECFSEKDSHITTKDAKRMIEIDRKKNAKIMISSFNCGKLLNKCYDMGYFYTAKEAINFINRCKMEETVYPDIEFVLVER